MIRETPALMVAHTVDWRQENTEAWSLMCSLLDGEVAAKRRCSLQWAAETTRKFAFVDVHGEPAYINNTILPILARLYISENPDARPFIELRRSRFDAFFASGGDSRAKQD